MSQPNQNLDLKDRKIFVGGLAWRTTTDDLRNFFQQFGDVLDANVVYETYPTLRSKGFGFVTFKDAESADRALANPSPIIDGRRANTNLAYLRAKDNNNNNTNHGSLNQTGPSHQNGPSHQYYNVNQVPPHQYPLTPQYPNPYFPPFYWNPNYGQVRYMPSVPYMTMTYPPLNVSPYGMQQNLQQRDTRLPVRISAPQSSPVRIQDVSENNKEVVVTADVKEIDTEPESDVDQEEEIMSGQDHNGLEQNVEEDIDVDTLIGHNETVFEGTYQNERVFEAEDTPQANGFDHDGNCECASQMNGIDQDAQGEEQMS